MLCRAISSCHCIVLNMAPSTTIEMCKAMVHWCFEQHKTALEIAVLSDCHIPVFRTQYQDYNYDFTRFFYLTTTPYEYLMTFIRITYIIRFTLIPNSLAETVNH